MKEEIELNKDIITVMQNKIQMNNRWIDKNE